MKKITKILMAVIMCMVVAVSIALPAFADTEDAAPAAETASFETAQTTDEDNGNSSGVKAIAAAICVGLAATAGAMGMAMAISKTNDSISRQPEASSSLRTSLMLGLVFIETAIIYALIVAILIIFVL